MWNIFWANPGENGTCCICVIIVFTYMRNYPVGLDELELVSYGIKFPPILYVSNLVFVF